MYFLLFAHINDWFHVVKHAYQTRPIKRPEFTVNIQKNKFSSNIYILPI